MDVRRIAATVMREQQGTSSDASHLCLLVQIPESDTPYLADVGFGGSMIKPIALIEAQHHQPPFKLGLDKLEDSHWRFWESLEEGRFSFDFKEEPACESALTEKCALLQSDPSSHFVLNLTAQRRSQDKHTVLRGKVLTTTTAVTTESRVLDSAEELVAVLAREFKLLVLGVDDLWPKISARHADLFGPDPGH